MGKVVVEAGTKIKSIEIFYNVIETKFLTFINRWQHCSSCRIVFILVGTLTNFQICFTRKSKIFTDNFYLHIGESICIFFFFIYSNKWILRKISKRILDVFRRSSCILYLKSSFFVILSKSILFVTIGCKQFYLWDRKSSKFFHFTINTRLTV